MYPFFSLTMLSLEAVSVINKRVSRIARGGTQSTDEVQLMLEEKASAVFEAMTNLMSGGTLIGMIARLREHVAANEARLSEGGK